jgi:ferredoxin-NADP reductase/MOSC domain-containing protein YiiM
LPSPRQGRTLVSNAGRDPEVIELATLLSLNVGLPKDVPWQGRTVHTGIWKYPVVGPRTVRTLNVDGDGQGDLNGHGGEQRAVLVYQSESYTYWRSQLGRADLEFGQFGENFTVDGLADGDVCIGDRYRIGTAEFEVTQPRVTCYRLGMRLEEPTMPSLLVAHHRPGFYLRVITQGQVQAGDEIVRTRIGPHALSVAAIDALLYLPDRDVELLRKAVDVPALSPGWVQSFRELLDAAENGATASAPPIGIEPGWSGFRPLRITRLVTETPTVTSIYLAAEDGAALPLPEPGQFLTLRVSGAGDPPPVRTYSISSGAETAGYRISVKPESRGVISNYLHARLKAGASIEAAAPRGDFRLIAGDNPVVLVSAGIGVTPVLAMLHHLASAHSSREVWWIHTARDADQHAFAAEAHDLIESLEHGHEYVFYTAADAEVDRSPIPVTRGRIDSVTLAGLGIPTDATAYLCGPDRFTLAVRDALVHLGLPPTEIHSELFGSRAAINPGLTAVSRTPPHQPAGDLGTGPLITFARSGLSVRWAQRYPALLELAEACDVPTRWSCRTGVCHTCETPLLAGTITYTPEPLELPAPDNALLCCAQPAEDLTVDL